MKHTAIVALCASALLTTGAEAFPAPKATPLSVSTTSTVEKAHYPYYRHCHWRHGYRYCYRGYAYAPYYDYGPYYYGPSFAIVIGRRHHHHHW
jgi:hypothetical protein